MMMHHTDFVWAADPTVSLSVCGEGSTAIIVLPGGGYNTCSPTESDPVAERFASLGYCAYVLRYSVPLRCGNITLKDEVGSADGIEIRRDGYDRR